jgi:hypothetical protein
MQVVSLPDQKSRDPKQMDRKWLALQLAAQLPRDAVEAILVLEVTLDLVKSFLASGGA